MEFLIEYGLFLAKTLTLIIGLLVLVGGLVSAGSKLKQGEKKGHIEVEKLNDHYEEVKETLLSVIQTPEDYKQHQKSINKQKKEDGKQAKKKEKKLKKQNKSTVNTVDEGAPETKKRLFVLDFHGDIKASEADGLEKMVSAILSVATEKDEVVVRLESGGGMVHSYGLASSQLARLRNKKISLTVCVDKVAASGGYMMACIADKILAAPFAVIGSIGVLAQLPNFNRVLKKYDIDYEQITAGEYKRTLTMFGENTDKGREKFKEEIQDTHDLFKTFVQEYRPSLNIDEVATGEVWFGSRALEQKLIDSVQTAEDYLLENAAESDVFKVSYVEKHSLQERLGLAASHGISSVIDTLLHRDRESQIFR